MKRPKCVLLNFKKNCELLLPACLTPTIDLLPEPLFGRSIATVTGLGKIDHTYNLHTMDITAILIYCDLLYTDKIVNKFPGLKW